MRKLAKLTPIAVAAALAGPLLAADFIVTRYDDPAPDGCLAADCSLREAVIAANAGADADRILLSAGTYTLSIPGTGEHAAATGDLDLLKDVEIVGPGATMTTIASGGIEKVFQLLGSSPIVRIAGVTILGGPDAAFGAAIGLTTGALTLEQVEVRDSAGSSAAIALSSSPAALVVRSSAIAGNAGGAISVSGAGVVTIENSTLSGTGTLIRLNGSGSTATCNHCTFVSTSTAIFVNANNGATFNLGNSIVAGACVFLNGGSVTSLGGNLESAGDTCALAQASDQTNVSSVNLALGAIGANGGPTRTHLPDASSAAVGGAEDALCLLGDQRGVVRETDCESGAVERANTAIPTPIFIDGFQQGDPEAWSATVGVV